MLSVVANIDIAIVTEAIKYIIIIIIIGIFIFKDSLTGLVIKTLWDLFTAHNYWKILQLDMIKKTFIIRVIACYSLLIFLKK